MEQRRLGRTGVTVSALGFGCGAVGGLMVRGDPADQERAVARALEHGVTYFDTAVLYGNGASEENLGRVLKRLKPAIFLSTKFTILPDDRRRIAEAVAASLEGSLRRLGRDSVDLLQLHNRIARDGEDRPLDPAIVLDEVVPALDRLKRAGKIRFAGITALGETPLLHRVVDAGVFDTAQIVYNLLNPTAGGAPLPAGLPGQDFGDLLGRAGAAGMGTIGIRILAGGALSGSEARHPTAMASVAPIASGPDYASDVAAAHRFAPLVAEGHAGDLVEGALRFAMSHKAMSTVLVGTATLDQLEHALAAAEKGPLPPAALACVAALRG
jgi:aryl-alcohol dehydrogenase-like predicted oxidoreductase